MTHVVADNCIKCKHTDCVEVCPVDCFVEGPNFLAIDPNGCIDCAICIPECPVGAIYPDNDTTIDTSFWVDINKQLSEHWPTITKKKPAPPDADAWDGVPNKLELLETWDGKFPFKK